MRASQLQGLRVVDEAGRRIGRVEEIRLEAGRVSYLVCGRGGYLQRFMSWRGGRRIAWDAVRRMTDKELVIAD